MSNIAVFVTGGQAVRTRPHTAEGMLDRLPDKASPDIGDTAR